MRHCARREKPCRVRGKGSDFNQSLNETNAQANKGRNHEQQQQRLSGNGSAKRGNPRHSGIYQGGNGGENVSHGNTPLHTNQSLNETDAETDKGHDDESQNQGIGGNGPSERTNPLYSFGYQRGNISYDSGDSDSSFLHNTPFQNIMLNGLHHG